MSNEAALHPIEGTVLRALPLDRGWIDEGILFATLAGTLPEASVRRGLELLKSRGAIEAETNPKARVETPRLTDLGERYAVRKLPVFRLWTHIQSHPGGPMSGPWDDAGLAPEEVAPALGELRKAKAVEARDGKLYVVGSRPSDAVRLQQAVLEEVAQHPGASLSSLPGDAERETARQMSRGRFALLTIETKESRRWRVTTAGVPLREDAHRTGGTEEIGELTPESLRDGSWKTAKPRAYNLSLQPPRIVAGRRHPYRSFLDGVRAKLVSLGFEEMHGPLVESEFWNMDALYMPQTHPARAIHDVYRVETRSHAGDLPAPLLGRVAAAHERGEGCGSRGWGYAFDRDATARLVLRSQGTALSSRWMAMHAKSPGKYFAIARCFRPDVVDATHASDFYQVEGIVIGTEIHYGHLRGLLEMFGRELAQAEACEVRPGYFPFTEPSVEAFIRHPRIGWMEMGGAGLFRPEVTTPPGVKGQVIAWGLGLDRMAMVALGVDDIRDLFATRLDTLRKMRSAPLV